MVIVRFCPACGMYPLNCPCLRCGHTGKASRGSLFSAGHIYARWKESMAIKARTNEFIRTLGKEAWAAKVDRELKDLY